MRFGLAVVIVWKLLIVLPVFIAKSALVEGRG